MAETNIQTTVPPIGTNVTRDVTNPQSDVAQHVHGYGDYSQTRSSPWRGGENHWDGPHDTFCFLCNEKLTSSLLECQTCENCYHASCTLPDWGEGNAAVPEIWFCDHCVDDGWSVPPVEGGDMDGYVMPFGIAEINQAHCFGYLASDQARSQPSAYPTDTTITVATATGPILQQSIQSSSQPPGRQLTGAPTQTKALATTSTQKLAPLLTSTNELQKPTLNKRTRPRSLSPPTTHRKRKSKYSPYSAEVEKALWIITSELEKSGKQNNSSKTLQVQVEELEQQLRMRGNEAMLLRQENDSSKRKIVELENMVERGKKETDSVRRNRASVIREKDKWEMECGVLKGRLEEKEEEGVEWRRRLRDLVGGELIS